MILSPTYKLIAESLKHQDSWEVVHAEEHISKLLHKPSGTHWYIHSSGSLVPVMGSTVLPRNMFNFAERWLLRRKSKWMQSFLKSPLSQREEFHKHFAAGLLGANAPKEETYDSAQTKMPSIPPHIDNMTALKMKMQMDIKLAELYKQMELDRHKFNEERMNLYDTSITR